MGRLFDAFTQVKNPAEARRSILAALLFALESPFGHISDFRKTVESGVLSDVTLGELDNLSGMIKSYGHYMWKNPCWDYLAGLQNQVFRIEEAIGEKTWLESEFFVDFSKPIAGLNDAVALSLLDDGTRYWGFGITHPKRHFFNRRHLKLLEWVRPYIASSLANLDRLEEWQSERDSLFKASPNPIAVLKSNENGGWALDFATPSALEILDLARHGSVRNVHFYEFLRCSVFAAGRIGGSSDWNARDGKHYSLSARTNTSATGIATITVRLYLRARTDARPGTRKPVAVFSKREDDVFSLLAKGMGDREIARDLGISFHTVHAHIKKIYRKTGVKNRVQAINAKSLALI